MKKIILLTLFVSNIFATNISTYLKSDILSSAQVEKKLKKAGFKIIGSYNAMQNKDYKIITYTSPRLIELASKKNRAFAAVQKVMISKIDNILLFTNPQYFLEAFLQDDINKAKSDLVLKKLKNEFTLTSSDYSLVQSDLKDYHFMFGMPFYEDMLEVASGNDLIKKLKKNAASNIVFELKVKNATLYGISMQNKNGEKNYLSILNEEKSAVFLPYMLMIENNKAMILHPKYYLALSLPKLTMGEFMNIMDTPTHIEDYFISLFK